ncbi:hypothetical protein RSAG8_11886, partial [Rhizoctonia solani AG-8 WAC10335]
MIEQGTLNIGSGNDERRGLGTPVSLVLEHNGWKVAIGRNPNYQETIASIKKNVREFKSTPNDQIIMLAFLAEVDDHVQLTEEVWADLLPRLVTIRVESNNRREPGAYDPATITTPIDYLQTGAGVERVTADCAQDEVAAAGSASNRRAQLEARRKQREAALAKL